MFEDSTFETMGTIHTRSRGWMMATFAFNSSILLALIFIPLMYPSVLPQIANAIQLLAPPTQVEEPRPVPRQEHALSNTEMPGGSIQAPRQIPETPWIPTMPEPPGDINPGLLSESGPGGPANPFASHGTHPDVQPAALPARHVSSGVMQGMLIYKVVPKYPPVAIAVRASGTVMLQATISRNGTIENLRVLGGPALLQQAALDAVKQWRYRPYVLDGQPVEVETTINVQFTLE
jgi:protein TonB